MNNPDWNDLRYFLTVTTAGSLSAAARELGVEHTTVSRRIEALEAVLNVRLFDRLARGWAISEAGKALLPQALRVEQEFLGLLRQASGSDSLYGTVRISAPPAIAAHWIAPNLPALQKQLVGVQIELAAETAQVDLARREADIAIRYRRPQLTELAVRAIATVQYYLCAAPEYLAANTEANWQFIGYDESLASLPQHAWLQGFAGSRPFILNSNDLNSISCAVRAGAGVAVLPHYLAADLIIRGVDCPVKRQLWMVMHGDIRKSPRVRKTADLLVELFSTSAR